MAFCDIFFLLKRYSSLPTMQILVTDDVIGFASTVLRQKIKNISASNEAMRLKLGRDFAPYEKLPKTYASPTFHWVSSLTFFCIFSPVQLQTVIFDFEEKKDWNRACCHSNIKMIQVYGLYRSCTDPVVLNYILYF